MCKKYKKLRYKSTIDRIGTAYSEIKAGPSYSIQSFDMTYQLIRNIIFALILVLLKQQMYA